MKKILFFLLFSFCLHSQAQFVTIPDPNFRAFLVANYPSCFNASQQMDTTCSGIVNEDTLEVSNLGISSIEGIGHFDKLKFFDCGSNNLTYLPTLPDSLRKLICYNNSLSVLPILPSGLKHIHAANCNFTTLPILPNGIQTVIFYSNQITSLTVLPNSIDTLVLTSNYLTNIDSLPINIKGLDCGNNQLITLPVLPQSLKILIFSNNNISNIPTLPSNLEYLYFRENNITNLPQLPNTIKHLVCSNNNIYLNKIPDSLVYLECYFNNLNYLPTLPNTLTYLHCSYNNLISLPILPAGLKEIFCVNNNLTSIPSLPNGLIYLFVENNPLLNCLPILPDSIQITTSSTSINCVPNLPPNLNQFPILPLCTSGSACEPQPTLSGKVFHDVNGNGFYDLGIDFTLFNRIISNSNGWVASSSPNGEYQMKLDSGVVNTFSLSPLYIYSNINPTSYTITPTSSGSQGNNYDFAVQLIPNIQDLRVDIANGPARPGFNQWVNVMANNVGTTNVSNATVKVLKPSTFTFINSIPAISTQIGDTLIWNNIKLNVFQQTGFAINWSIPSTAVIGTPYQIESWILPSVGDTTPANNYVMFNGVLQGSYDPNDKTVSKTIISTANLDEELKYTIRFQNTGTDTAFNIVVRDELSNNLDISTFKMLGASDNYSFLIREKGLLEVFFQNIQLPDSNINEPASHGFFEYSIKPKATMTANDSIFNTAQIYFDFNSPIITNTVVTKMIVTNINELSTIEANIFPNPTTGILNIELNETKATFTLTDINGRILIEKKFNQKDEINVNHLPAGIYIGKIKTNKGFKVVKIVKED